MSALADEIKNCWKTPNCQKAESALKRLIRKLHVYVTNCGPLELNMQKEFEDIEALEKLGMKTLFYKVLGSQQEQLEKERQDYLQASLKYDQVRKSLKYY